MDDMHFVGAAASWGAIALEDVRLYDSVQEDYDAFRRDMIEWRTALGHEWMAGESVASAQELIKGVT